MAVGFPRKIGHFENYLSKVEETCPGISESLRVSIEAFAKEHFETFAYLHHVTGLLLGHIQSGKTSQMLGVISKAADLDFRLFILLTTDSILLHKQTINRAFAALDTLNVCGETDDDRFRKEGLRTPTLIVLKKNSKVLKTWLSHFASVPACTTEPIVILDDEADAASLNTKINNSDISTINRLISSIRRVAPSSLYLQVTATPQAPLLQNIKSGWKPEFVHFFHPGEGYLGGEFFYGETSTCQRLTDPGETNVLLRTDKIPEGLRKAIITFLLIGSYQIFLENQKVTSLLIHPSVKIEDHECVERKVLKFLSEIAEDIRSSSSSLEYVIIDSYNDLRKTKNNLPPLDTVRQNIEKALRKTNVIVLNSNTMNGVDYSAGMNILIGGNSLGRGVTFPSLQVVYYCRTVKTPQADTMWQHSRAFGYDRDKGLCRLFMPPQLRHIFRELTEAQDALFAAIKKHGIEGITILSPVGTRPTRKNVVDRSSLSVFVGGVNYFLGACKTGRLQWLDTRLGLNDSESEITLAEANEILEKVGVEDEVELATYRSCLTALQSAGESLCRLYVRTNRNITKGTGTLLSPVDRNEVARIKDLTTLVLYRLNGAKNQGWEGTPLWVPNVKFPEGRCFFTSDL